MRYTLIALLLLTGCGMKQEPPSESTSSAKKYEAEWTEYVKSKTHIFEKNGLCFAVIKGYPHSLTHVPCEKVIL